MQHSDLFDGCGVRFCTLFVNRGRCEDEIQLLIAFLYEINWVFGGGLRKGNEAWLLYGVS